MTTAPTPQRRRTGVTDPVGFVRGLPARTARPVLEPLGLARSALAVSLTSTPTAVLPRISAKPGEASPSSPVLPVFRSPVSAPSPAGTAQSTSDDGHRVDRSATLQADAPPPPSPPPRSSAPPRDGMPVAPQPPRARPPDTPPSPPPAARSVSRRPSAPDLPATDYTPAARTPAEPTVVPAPVAPTPPPLGATHPNLASPGPAPPRQPGAAAVHRSPSPGPHPAPTPTAPDVASGPHANPTRSSRAPVDRWTPGGPPDLPYDASSARAADVVADPVAEPPTSPLADATATFGADDITVAHTMAPDITVTDTSVPAIVDSAPEGAPPHLTPREAPPPPVAAAPAGAPVAPPARPPVLRSPVTAPPDRPSTTTGRDDGVDRDPIQRSPAPDAPPPALVAPDPTDATVVGVAETAPPAAQPSPRTWPSVRTNRSPIDPPRAPVPTTPAVVVSRTEWRPPTPLGRSTPAPASAPRPAPRITPGAPPMPTSFAVDRAEGSGHPPVRIGRPSRPAGPVLGRPIRTDRAADAAVDRQPDAPAPAATQIVTVQRAAVPQPAAAMAVPEPDASLPETPGDVGPDPGAEQSPKEMVDQLWPHIERRLRMNLLLERERKGTLSGALWSAGGG